MNRRNFLRTMIGGVEAAAAVRTFPFRVYSFPSEIVQPAPIWKWFDDHRGDFIVQPEWDFFFLRESDGARKQTLFRIGKQ